MIINSRNTGGYQAVIKKGKDVRNTEEYKGYYPLAMASAGEDVSIVSFSSRKNLQQKLKDLGLTVGAQVRILKNDLGCPLLLAIGDTRVALGHGLAHKIMARSVI